MPFRQGKEVKIQLNACPFPAVLSWLRAVQSHAVAFVGQSCVSILEWIRRLNSSKARPPFSSTKKPLQHSDSKKHKMELASPLRRTGELRCLPTSDSGFSAPLSSSPRLLRHRLPRRPTACFLRTSLNAWTPTSRTSSGRTICPASRLECSFPARDNIRFSMDLRICKPTPRVPSISHSASQASRNRLRLLRS